MSNSTVIISGNKVVGNLSPIFFDGAMSLKAENAKDSPSFSVADSYNPNMIYEPKSNVEEILPPTIDSVGGVKVINIGLGSGIGAPNFYALKDVKDFCFIMVADINLSGGQANGIIAEFNAIFNSNSEINAGFFVRRAGSATNSMQFTVDGGASNTVSSASVSCPTSGMMVIVASASSSNGKTSIMVNGVESEVDTPAQYKTIPGDGAFTFGYRYNYKGTGRMPLKMAKAGICNGYFDASERLAICKSLMSEFGIK